MNSILRGLLLLILAGEALAQTPDEWERTIREAILSIETLEQNALRYQQVIRTGDELETVEVSPEWEPRWRLLSIDGEAATKREQSRFVREQEKEQARRAGESLADLIRDGSLSLLSDPEAGVLEFSFEPEVEGMEDVSQLEGRLTWSRTQNALVSMRIVSNDAFSPRFSVTVEQLDMHFQFQQLTGVSVPKRYDFIVRGKFAGLKTFDIASVIEYRDIEIVR